MDAILLGSGGMMPMPGRLLTSLAVRHQGRVYLFDAGEAVQLGLKTAHLGLRGLDLIAISHLHADHCLGLPGLLMLRAQMETPEPLTVLGPPGIADFVQAVRSTTDFYLNYPICFIEHGPDRGELAYQDAEVKIYWQPLVHSRPCLGYRLEERPRPGRFHPERARAQGVLEGKLWSRLQNGEVVELDDGSEVTPEQVLDPPRAGRVVSYGVDTRPCEGLVELVRDADLAVLDSMFSAEQAEHARDKGHMTAEEAAEVARDAGVSRLVLAHLSPRHDAEALQGMHEEARQIFAATELGVDGARYEIALPPDAG